MLAACRWRYSRLNAVIALFCAVLVVVIWVLTLQRVRFERDETITHAMTMNANLARSFEEHARRTLKGLDELLLLLSYLYQQHGARVNMGQLIDSQQLDRSLFTAIGIVNERGLLVAADVAAATADFADRAYFRAHQAGDSNQLFIGKPTLGRVTGKLAFHLSRRINRPDGSFAGVAMVAVDPSYFTELYRQASLGKDGLVALVGLDGVARARHSGELASTGLDMRESELLSEQARQPVGSLLTSGAVDGIPRFISYRTLRHHPLLIAVGTSEQETLASFSQRRSEYYLLAGLASGFIALFGLGMTMGLSRQQRNMADLARSEAQFRATFDQAAVGIAHTGIDGRYLCSNAKLSEVLGYSAEELTAMSLKDIVHPEDMALVLDDRRRLQAGELNSAVREERYIRKDGSIAWVSRGISLVRDPSGKASYFIALIQDVSERRRAEAALKESQENFDQLASHIPEAFWIIDARSKRLVYLSPAHEQICGQPFATLEAAWRGWNRIIHREDRERVEEALQDMHDRAFDVQYRIVRADLRTRWVRLRGYPVRDGRGEAYRIAGTIEDITERKELQERLLHQAHYDSLTQLPNRALYHDRLALALSQARRQRRILGVLFIDLDRFKLVNDNLGHGVGDELLRQVAERLKQCLRAGDTVGRLGGDEFAIVLPELSAKEGAAVVAQKIIGALASPFQIHGHEVYTSASIGIATHPGDGDDLDSLIKHADQAMFGAKDLGRNNFHFYSAEMTERALGMMQHENRLRHALERQEFVLHFQPRGSIASGAITGCEALLRWQPAGSAMVPPGDFIPLLEDSGLIVPVGEWIIDAACAQLRGWIDLGIAPVPIAVNLSAKQFAHHDLGAIIDAALVAHKLPAELLEIEITESAMMMSPEDTVRTLRQISARGIRIAIDDFGTGYSSLSYLKRFPIDAVKLDGSFVRGLPDNAEDASIARAVITMAHSLKLEVVAEGVETAAQRAFLAAHGCEEMQGFYFSRPLAAAEMHAFLGHAGRPPAKKRRRQGELVA